MITAELISAAPMTSSPWAVPTEYPIRIGEWLCSGTWATREPSMLSLAKSVDNDPVSSRHAHVVTWDREMPGIPLVEDETKRLPFVAGTEDVKEEKCRDCNGTGEHDCNCTDCDIGCDTCDGEGLRTVTKGTPEDVGQRVYLAADGMPSIVQARLGALLDGYRVVRLGTTVSQGYSAAPCDISPVGGVDESGRLIVIVMPMRKHIRSVP